MASLASCSYITSTAASFTGANRAQASSAVGTSQGLALPLARPLRRGGAVPKAAFFRTSNRRPARHGIIMDASKPGSSAVAKPTEDDVSDRKMLQYCSINKDDDKKSLGELEQEFLAALQSFYFDGKPTMSNEEFDNLKEELQWEGSRVVMLNPEEQRFLEASLAYFAGKPILSDSEFDALKRQLKKQGSQVAMGGPRCSLRTKNVYSDSQVDYLRMTLLNLPAALIALGLVFFIDDLTGFEITYLIELPEPYSALFTWLVVLPLTYFLTSSITKLGFKDALILKGPCPSCNTENLSFFGTILTISNTSDTNDVKCESCGASLKFEKEARIIKWDQTKPEEKKKPPPKAKAAPARA